MRKLDINAIFKDHCRYFVDMKGLIDFFNAHTKFIWSWGAHDFKSFDEKCLRFSVNGHHHKGYVYIFLHASDVFEIYLTDTNDTITDEADGVYIDELIRVLDKKIEWIDEYGSN